MQKNNTCVYIGKKSRNGDTPGPVELIVWLEQGYQGDWHEQDDQGQVSLCLCVCVFVFVVVFVIVFVFVFVSS